MSFDLTAIQNAAKQADTILDQVMKVEPAIVGTIGVFVPAVAVVQPFVLAAYPAIDKALEAIAAGNGGDMVDALAQLIKHILPGQANSPALAPEAPTPAVTPG